MQNNYTWEVELENGTIVKKGNNFNKEVKRFSLIPNSILLPRHDIIFSDFKYKYRFCRCFMKVETGTKQYVHCIVTDKFRIYIMYNNGRCLIVDKDYELYI